jgi:arylsulfatase A-like enzyme
MGPRGDAIAQMDWCTGVLIRTLERLGVAENTLVIFSSDNGPILDDGYDDLAEELVGDHDPAGLYRGAKYSIYEAGTRVPTITWWPAGIEAGESHALVTQVDLLASLAQLVDQELPIGAAPDSYSMMDTWLGRSANGRSEVVEEAFTLALRQGDWKYIRPVEGEIPEWFERKKVESGLSNVPQLYNLEEDPAEQTDLALEQPERVVEMARRLQGIIDGGGSRPGWHTRQ